jgi:1,4-dihydroxy-2-naphthoyl-CoA hydrolase
VTDYSDQVVALGAGELAETMGIEILEASAARLVGRMPVAGNRQPFGLLHGGANVVLAETLGSIAAAIHGGPERVPVGIEVSATHHRSVTSGHVTGEARAISLGSTLATYEITIVDDEGRRTCTARLTCLLRGRPSA